MLALLSEADAIFLTGLIAASASVYNAAKNRKVEKRTRTSNGKTLGEMVEANRADLKKFREDFDTHAADADIHHHRTSH